MAYVTARVDAVAAPAQFFFFAGSHHFPQLQGDVRDVDEHDAWGVLPANL